MARALILAAVEVKWSWEEALILEDVASQGVGALILADSAETACQTAEEVTEEIAVDAADSPQIKDPMVHHNSIKVRG